MANSYFAIIISLLFPSAILISQESNFMVCDYIHDVNSEQLLENNGEFYSVSQSIDEFGNPYLLTNRFNKDSCFLENYILEDTYAGFAPAAIFQNKVFVCGLSSINNANINLHIIDVEAQIYIKTSVDLTQYSNSFIPNSLVITDCCIYIGGSSAHNNKRYSSLVILNHDLSIDFYEEFSEANIYSGIFELKFGVDSSIYFSQLILNSSNSEENSISIYSLNQSTRSLVYTINNIDNSSPIPRFSLDGLGNCYVIRSDPQFNSSTNAIQKNSILNGDSIWTKVLDQSIGVNTIRVVKNILSDSVGNTYILGRVTVFSPLLSVTNKPFLFKLDPFGDIVWNRIFIDDESLHFEEGEFVDAFIKADSSILVIGNIYTNNARKKIVLNLSKNGCLDEDCDFVNVLTNTIKLEENGANRLTVFPNPASQEFKIILPQHIKGIIRMYDCRGALSLEKGFNSNKTTINVSDLKSGQYFINVHAENIEIKPESIIIIQE